MTAADILRIIESGGKLMPLISRITIGNVTVYERGA
jgi:hypothetical protein